MCISELLFERVRHAYIRVQYMLQAEISQDNQRRGKSGQMVDPRPETVDGDIKIVITPQLVHDIFEEYPVVAKAYNDNVPKQASLRLPLRETGF